MAAPLEKFHQVENARSARHLAVNFDNGVIYCASDRHVTGFDPVSGQVDLQVSLDSVEDVDRAARVVGLHHLAEDCALCVATSTGDILLVNLDTTQVEGVGSVASGVTAMGWSPASEIVCITTAEFVQVGWGKKETQFHGSVGKQAAQVKAEAMKPVTDWDDRCPRVTWRGDGMFFAIGSIHPDTGARQVCVWSREGVHHSTSENVDGIEQSLAWRPSGSLIATSQRRPNKHDIAFFEKNGLRHGEFTLPFKPDEIKVVEVCWNSSSTVLAVWCEDIDNKNSYVQLWTTGNYHWYLKQSLQFPGGEGHVRGVTWDPEHEFRLHVLAGAGGYLQYTWAWTTSNSQGRTGDDQAIVAVIDGASVLMTPMRDMIVPPPMCAYKLELPAPVNQVVFAPPPHSNDLAVVLIDNRIVIYRFEGKPAGEGVKVEAAGGNGFKHCCQFPTLQGIYSITGLEETSSYPLCLSHFTWVGDDVIVFSTVTMDTCPRSVLHKARIGDSAITVERSCPVESQIFGVAFDPNSLAVAIQLMDGSLLKYDHNDDMVLPWETSKGEEVQFVVPCSSMAVCDIGGEIASNCTSMMVHDEFLLLTTLQHTCRCISRHTPVKDLPTLSDGKAHPFDESIRRVERGSQIVISVPDDTKLVLQMPRGNLETIHPRALVLTAVRKQLDKLQFNEAFTIMRKHRINMNLLNDHNPEVFTANVGLFVRQVANVNHINLFLTDLLEEDVTVTMYTAAYERNKSVLPGGLNTQEQGKNKINTVCDAIRQALIDIDENQYLLSILTTYVRKTKPELEEALHIVKKLRELPVNLPHISAEEALKYLVFLVDVNELYDIALGTYDFNLVLMVAEKSQKDPKEYIPFLNDLRKLETNYQRFTIDKHLKRYEKALTHIVKCGPEHFQECLSLVNEHKLHTQALQLYPPSSSQYKEIANGYGDVLAEKRRHDEAAIMYVKGENWEAALSSYLACHQWQQVFCMTAHLKYSSDKEAEVARKLAEELKGRSRWGDAAVVQEQYAGEVEEAIVTLVQGSLWDEALRLMHKYKRTDFIETDLKPQLLESVEGLHGNLEQTRNTFLKQKARLAVVRQEKEKQRLELIESGGVCGGQDSDLFSDTSSATGESIQSSTPSTSSSVYSKMSGRSVKNRRKLEHKKWRLKEGSEFEDFALIASLAKSIKYVDDLRDEVRSLVRALVMFHYDKRGEQLQRDYDALLILLDQSIPEIWIDEDKDTEFKPVLGPTMTANAIALSVQQGRSVQTAADKEETTDPVVRFAPVLQKEKRWKLYALET
ncbi:ELP1-like protein [Mya arenaria]|uniref:Elongator complex protein 1 n=1 Tax=Mya arenaria TaxID=6604 RepID=A0ABY7DZB2_MYAAR|nr:ELP1-like protein [Mya arenaria]